MHVSSGHFDFSIKRDANNLKINYLCNQQSLTYEINAIDILAFISTRLEIITLIGLFLVECYF